jgi:hypothetical protein
MGDKKKRKKEKSIYQNQHPAKEKDVQEVFDMIQSVWKKRINFSGKKRGRD